MKKVLFVCTGNTCRSPMAEGIFKKLIEERGFSRDIQVESAGLAVLGKSAANLNALKAMEEMGIDISQHSSRGLTSELLDSADIILTMTQGHKGQILMAMPQVKDKVYTLLELIDQEGLDIVDPFGMDLDTYKKTAQELEVSIEKALPKIIKKIFR